MPATRLLCLSVVLTAIACSSEGPPAAAGSSAAAASAPAPAGSTLPVEKPSTAQREQAGVLAYLDDKGVTIKVGGKAVGSGCTGESGVTAPAQRDGAQDFEAVRACARRLKSEPRLADETSVTVSASSGSRYADVIGLIDSLRSDSKGEIFPEFQFGMPPAWASGASSQPSVSAPVTTPGLPTGEPSEDGVVLRISKTQITVGEEADPVVSYEKLDNLREAGLDAKHKRNGANDLYIVPLATVLNSYRAIDKRIREAKGLDASTSELIVVADADVPFRVLMEVLYTAGQSEFGKYNLMVRTNAKDKQ